MAPSNMQTTWRSDARGVRQADIVPDDAPFEVVIQKEKELERPHEGGLKGGNPLAGLLGFLANLGRSNPKDQGRKVRFSSTATTTSATPTVETKSERNNESTSPKCLATTDVRLDVKSTESTAEPQLTPARRQTQPWATAGARSDKQETLENEANGNGKQRLGEYRDVWDDRCAAVHSEHARNTKQAAMLQNLKARGMGHARAVSKRSSFTEETFVPCYATFTPRLSGECLQEIKYRAPETRVTSAVAPPSSVARPNYHDALRRVAVVVYQHIKTCEWRREVVAEKARENAIAWAAMDRSDAEGEASKKQVWTKTCKVRSNSTGRLWGATGVSASRPSAPLVSMTANNYNEPFNARKAELFHETQFISPTFRYKFVQAPVMALPGAMFTLREVKMEPKAPTVDQIYDFVKTLFNKACLSSECSLVCLIYVERLMEKAGVPLLASTWKPILLCGLLLASKVWQDLSSWNVEFSTVYPEYSIKSINRLELLFLSHMGWDMSISSSLYAKYYFALRSLAEKKDFRRRYNQVMQIDAPRANRVQERTDALKRDIARSQSLSMLSKSL